MMTGPKLYFLLLPFFALSKGFCQLPATSTDFEKNTLEAIRTRHVKDLNSLQGAYKKYLADIYKERFDLIKNKFTNKEILVDHTAQAYLDRLTEKILLTNHLPEPKELRILFSKSYLPNASSMGEGTILFNIGLFHRLQNESQAAFVLCHELAHYYLNHSNNSIDKYVTTVYSDDFQKQIKNIKKSEYGVNSQLEKLTRNLLFKNRRHSREFEQSADSMAVELMKNTGYDIKESLTCLALLDSVDKDKYHPQLNLEKIFNFSAFPFKKSWLEDDDLRFIGEKDEISKQDEDSLKTHPECSLRIARLEKKVTDNYKTDSRKNLVSEVEFNNLRTAFDYQIIDYAIQSNQVARALFLALEMLDEHPGDAKLQGMVGKCFNEIYKNQKSHTLSTIVDLPGPGFNQSYNALLRLIQNLRLSEVAALSYYFLKQHENISINNEDFVAALITSKEHLGKEQERQQWVDFYQQKFPKGNHQFK